MMSSTLRTHRVTIAATVAALTLGGTAAVALAQSGEHTGDHTVAPTTKAEVTAEATTSETGAEESFTTEFQAHELADVTMIRDCDGTTPLNRPATVTLTCADGLMTLENLEWFDWGSDAAMADGQLVIQPTAAEGKSKGKGSAQSYPVTVTVDELVNGEAVQDYGRITVDFLEDRPAFEKDVFSQELPTVEASSGLDG